MTRSADKAIKQDKEMEEENQKIRFTLRHMAIHDFNIQKKKKDMLVGCIMITLGLEWDFEDVTA